MRSLKEIQKDKRVMTVSVGPDGGMGFVILKGHTVNGAATAVWSNGGGWDHVSISYPDRTPTWDEMKRAKEIFFEGFEAAIEIHPPQSEYVNAHDHCLHIWRPQKETLPLPPYWMVGPKAGQNPR